MTTLVPIPDRLKKRPVYGGMAVAFTTIIHPDGIPDFKTLDLGAWHMCVDHLLCPACAEPLEYWVCYIGSKDHIEKEQFVDMAMHRECAAYAAAVCPYIVYGKAYGHHIRPPSPGMTIIELAPRSDFSETEAMPLFMAIGRRSGIRKLSSDPHMPVISSGTLVEVIPIERVQRTHAAS